MRKWYCVPMITLCILLIGCRSEEQKEPEAKLAQQRYQSMSGGVMEAVVSSGIGCEEDAVFRLHCEYVPEGASRVEVLEPETVAGVCAIIDSGQLTVTYEDLCLPAGTLSRERISPAACLPWLMDSLRDGWLLEQSDEELNGTPCLRLCLDESDDGASMESTLWLRKEDYTPLRGEISVDGEIILTAEFTNFQFCDIITKSVSMS